MKIYIAVFGSGLGHASRMLKMAEELKGVEVRFSSTSKEASSYIRRKGYICYDIPLIDVSWREGGVYYRRSLVRAPKLILTFLLQIKKEIHIMKRFKPNLVLSDSRLSAIIASKLLSIPCFLVTNQIKVVLPSKRRIVKILEKIEGGILAFFWSLSDKILIPDLPYPFTIAEDSLPFLKNLKYIGFFPSKENELVLSNLREEFKGKPLIFAQISGPTLSKVGLVKILINLALKLNKKYNFVISLGDPNGSSEVKKIGGLWIYSWCPYVEEFFEISDLLIIRGGHSSISKALWYGKPMICIPIRMHGEQISNSKKVEKLGLGICIEPKNLNETILISSIEEILENNSYRERCKRIKEIARRRNAVDFLLEEILKNKN
ncbi:UDP-N-acetylglucosamine--N-acetylmuramyl-(pentapeptide) pyrophosphoryl-undecaprenol N-acetylglucosamine transferase [archaeon HR06]|nr:UDP-N-acetylglucosamine--N-acetylmuramyl-(pentapeptide) pyrophosphoryl-undecaprenol N-acetylglucosamine transferase [archaeon HR06]